MNFPQLRVCRNSGRATPSLHRDKRAAIRYKPNPAERHLSFAGNCSDNRRRLSYPDRNGWLRIVCLTHPAGGETRQRVGRRAYGYHCYTAITVTLPFRVVSLDPLMVGYTEASYRDEMCKVAAGNLAAVSAETERQGISCHLIHREHEHPWEAIINTALEENSDLIAMASHGRRGLSAVFMGSQTNKVLTHSSIPVLVTRPLPGET